ncbi:acp7 [Symbiodinium sp. CCMP2456]|nr:acp7 [Symbiodinium sp. CCMP2456]
MFDVSPKWNPMMPWLSGITTESTIDPPATTYIVTGSAGNVEDHEAFTRPAPKRSAKRLNTYGWSKMTVYNASHIYWQQFQTDSGQPPSTWGQVMDATWLVQNHHGPFSHHPHLKEVENSGVAGLRPIDTISVDMSFWPAGRRLQMQCKHAGHNQAPVCSDQDLSKQMVSKGRWQYTKSIDSGNPVDFV